MQLNETLMRAAINLANENIQRAIAGKTIVKEIYVPGRIYNIVVR